MPVSLSPALTAFRTLHPRNSRSFAPARPRICPSGAYSTRSAPQDDLLRLARPLCGGRPRRAGKNTSHGQSASGTAFPTRSAIRSSSGRWRSQSSRQAKSPSPSPKPRKTSSPNGTNSKPDRVPGEGQGHLPKPLPPPKVDSPVHLVELLCGLLCCYGLRYQLRYRHCADPNP